MYCYRIASYHGILLMQVMDIRQIGNAQSTQERYRLVLSDGIHLQQAMLATQLNEKVKNNLAVKGSVVQLLEYICNTVQNRKYALFVDLYRNEGCIFALG